MKTTGWEPSSIRWLLVDPYGETKYYVDGHATAVFKSTDSNGNWIYSISTDNGFIKIPAFATQGEWRLKATFSEKPFLFFPVHKTTKVIDTIPVEEGTIFDSLNAPFYFIFTLDMGPLFYYQKALSIDLPILILIPLAFMILILTILIIRRSGGYEKR